MSARSTGDLSAVSTRSTCRATLASWRGVAARDLALSLLQGQAQAVAPRHRRVGQRALELAEVGRRAVRCVELQRVERLGERRVAAARAGDRRHLAVPRRLQEMAEA